MENEIFDRNYETDDGCSERAAAIFDLICAPGGFLAKIGDKLDAIPKVIVPEDKKNYEYLLNRCDDFVRRHHGRIHAEVDYKQWDAHIDLYLPMVEFDDPDDMSLLKDIGEKAHYLTISPQEGGGFRIHIIINYFQELMSDGEAEFLKYETLMEDDELASYFETMPTFSPEEDALITLIRETLDRIENEAHIDRTTAFSAALDYMQKNRDPDGNDDMKRLSVILLYILEKSLDEQNTEE